MTSKGILRVVQHRYADVVFLQYKCATFAFSRERCGISMIRRVHAIEPPISPVPKENAITNLDSPRRVTFGDGYCHSQRSNTLSQKSRLSSRPLAILGLLAVILSIFLRTMIHHATPFPSSYILLSQPPLPIMSITAPSPSLTVTPPFPPEKTRLHQPTIHTTQRPYNANYTRLLNITTYTQSDPQT